MLYTIQNSNMIVTVSDYGAELQSIRTASGTEYLWQGDPSIWSERAPNIFPYVARMVNKTYYLDGKAYHMEIHGIAKYSVLDVVAQSENSITLELCDSDESYRSFPRHFCFRIHYRLEGFTLHIQFEVRNRDSKQLYFAVGGHPGFRAPISEGEDFSDYRIRFHTPCKPDRVDFTPECFVTGSTTPFPLEQDRFLFLKHDMFDEDAIVLKNCAREVTLENPANGNGVTVAFHQMDYLGLWHMPRTEAPYICIEPWSSLPAKAEGLLHLEEQADLLCLAPGEVHRNDWSITIHEGDPNS